MKRLACIVILATAALVPATTTYFIGNSVTDAINYHGLQALAESRGYTHVWGRHMIPGSPLDFLYDNPSGGIPEPPFGYYPNALPNYAWDFISLQPFDRHLDSDIAAVGAFADLARERSQGNTLIIYQRWPRKDDRDTTSAQGWNDAFLGPYTGGWDNSNETREYFEQLTAAVKEAQPGFRVIMAPVGEVLRQINDKMATGQVPGYSNIWQVYSDGIHFTGEGTYIVACTYFAAMYQEDPTGLGVPSEFESVDAVLRQVAQETAWDVVNNYRDPEGNPWSGVSGGGTVAATGVQLSLDSLDLTTGQTADILATVLPTNASNKAVTWFSAASDVASVDASGRVTGVSSGTATITATTEDGNFSASCMVRVVTGIPVEGVSVSPASDTVMVGQTLTLTATVTPGDATDKRVVWSSSDSSCASVSQLGVVTGRKIGGVTVSATTVNGGMMASCTVTVDVPNAPPVAVIKATPQSGLAPLTVTFDGTDSHDPDQDDFVLGYDWIFGDGTVASSNTATHTYRNAGTYIVKLVAMDSRQVRGDTAFDTIAVAANSSSPILISQGKAAVASSEENSQFAGYLPAANVNDGNAATRWGSNATDDEWIYIDLGAGMSFDRIVLRWEMAYAASFKLQTSDDSQAWTDIHSTTAGDGGSDTVHAHGTGRYVRMLGIRRGTAYGYSLYELEIYQMPGGTVAGPDRPSAQSVTGSGRTQTRQSVVYNLRGVRVSSPDGRRYTTGVYVLKPNARDCGSKARRYLVLRSPH